MGSPLLELHNVSRRFGGTRAVDGVTATFDAGLVYGLIGPNGSGKTTLINLISGQYDLDGGEIVLGGQHLERRRAHELAALGVVRTFQMPKAFGSLTVAENLLVPVIADHRREPLATVRGQAADVLRHVGLDHLASAPASSLSGGQTMLLQLARALMHAPVRLLLLDEPFAGVAPAIKERMMATIREINAQHGATVLLVSHEMTTVRALCRQVAVMNVGRIIAEGSLDEVAARPEVVEAYLGRLV
ncbi:MAG: ABC transporter ATP-binding protein [Chloroflexi bacterium]|nr:ABC transporter ATP-binding protein [Chloroflexota bacterium]